MNVIDSTCWIEYLMNTPISDIIAQAVENPAKLIVPTITIYEVYKKLTVEKGTDYAMRIIDYMKSGTIFMKTFFNFYIIFR